MTRNKQTPSSNSQELDDETKTTTTTSTHEETLSEEEENVEFSPKSKINTNPTNNNYNRTTNTAKQLSRIHNRFSPIVLSDSNREQDDPSSTTTHGVTLSSSSTDIVDAANGDESLSPPNIVTKSPTLNDNQSSPFKLNLSNLITYSQQPLSTDVVASSTSTTTTFHPLNNLQVRLRSVSEAILPNSARRVNNISSPSTEFQHHGIETSNNNNNNSGKSIISRSSGIRTNSSRNPKTSSPYYIPPPPAISATQSSPRSILLPSSSSTTTPRIRSPANLSSPRSALTPRQVTFFDESPSVPHSANAILLNQQLSPDSIFQTNNHPPPQSIVTTTATLAPKNLQGLQIPQEKYVLNNVGGNGPKSPLAPSVYESIFGVGPPHYSKQSIVFRHSFGNEFEGREDHDDPDIQVSDLSFNHKSPGSNSNNQTSSRTSSPQLTPRRLAQQVTSSIKAKLSPRNKKAGFSGLVDESNSLSSDLDVFSNDIGAIMHTNHSNEENITDVKRNDVRNIQVIATASTDPHHVKSGDECRHVIHISGDSNIRDGSNLSVSPNYLLPNMESESSSCQSPPTTSQLIIPTSNPNINRPIHAYSTSDLSTISPGMIPKGRASIGTDAEGKSVVSNHKKRKFQVQTCCGTIELSIFKLFALAALFVNILAFVWLAIILSLIYANQIDQYTIQTTTSLHSTLSIVYTREMISHLTKVTAYSSACSPLLLKYENFSYGNTTTYMNKLETDYQTLMSDLTFSKSFLSSDIVKNLENSSYMGKEMEAYQLLKNGQSLDALKLLESYEYLEQFKKEKELVVDPISSYFKNLGLSKTYEMSLLSLMGLVVVVSVFAFVVPLVIFILVCAFNRDSLHLERLNKASAVMLMDTMNNDTLRELFKKHCEFEYASENFSILEKINEYKKLCEKSFEIQVALFDIENNGPSDADVSSPVKRKPGGMEIDFPNSPVSPMRRKLFKKQFSEKDLERIEQEKYEIAFEIYTDYLDVNGERSVNINKSLSDKVKEQMDSYAKGLIDFLADDLFDTVELEVCVVLLDTHYRFKESLSFQKQMKIDKINKAKLVRKRRTKSLRYFQ